MGMNEIMTDDTKKNLIQKNVNKVMKIKKKKLSLTLFVV